MMGELVLLPLLLLWLSHDAPPWLLQAANAATKLETIPSVVRETALRRIAKHRL